MRGTLVLPATSAFILRRSTMRPRVAHILQLPASWERQRGHLPLTDSVRKRNIFVRTRRLLSDRSISSQNRGHRLSSADLNVRDPAAWNEPLPLALLPFLPLRRLAHLEHGVHQRQPVLDHPLRRRLAVLERQVVDLAQTIAWGSISGEGGGRFQLLFEKLSLFESLLATPSEPKEQKPP